MDRKLYQIETKIPEYMINRNKIIPFILLFFLINGIFVTMHSCVSASELVEDSWNTKTPMRYNRSQFSVIAFDGKIYVIGGDSNMGYQDINERYDPLTDSWTTLKPMPTPRAGFAIVEYQGKIYCIGGYTLDPGPTVFADLAVNEVYDVATDSWSTKTSMPVNASFIQAQIVDGKIFVITSSAMYMYNPVTNSWTNKGNTPTSGNFVFSAVIDNQIMVGYTAFDRQCKVVIYDPKTNEWNYGTSGPSLVGVRAIAGVTTGLYAPQRIYVFSNADDHVVYDPVSDTWSPAKTTRYYGGRSVGSVGVAIVDDLLYAIGGSSSPGGEAINKQYVPMGYYDAVSVMPDTSAPNISATPDSSTPNTPDSSEFFLNFSMIGALLILSVGIVVVGLFVYLNKRKKRFTRDTIN